MSCFNLETYNAIFFDCDGVLIDSNNVKKDNIQKAVEGCCTPQKANEFVLYFLQTLGIPRERKINKWFSAADAIDILRRYDELNNETIPLVPMIPGVREFLKSLQMQSKKCWVFTGADEKLVQSVLTAKNVLKYFVSVHGAPLDKVQNYSKVNPPTPALMFGDSPEDYNFAKVVGADFVFVSGASVFTEDQIFGEELGRVKIESFLGCNN